MATVYRAGIIGLARMGSWWDDQLRETTPVEAPSSHAGMYSACPRTQLVAGCDIDAEKRETFRRRWEVEAVYADYREMLARESLDVVSVVTSWASVQGAIAADVAGQRREGHVLREADGVVGRADEPHRPTVQRSWGGCRRALRAPL